MSNKRKDSKGRILKTGESQRKDGLYQYRYKGLDGKRKTVYDSELKRLRIKEKEIQAKLLYKEDYSKGDITVYELLKKYISIHKGVKYSTIRTYETLMNFLQNEPISFRKIGDVKTSEAQEWVLSMHNRGRKYSTINHFLSILNPAFQLACNENIIRNNPFSFKLSDVIQRDGEQRDALSKEQQKSFLEFVKNHRIYNKYLDSIIVLLGTGLRSGEFAGLTRNDLDFDNKTITVDHQLRTNTRRGKYIDSPKSKAGYRKIPMSESVEQALLNMIKDSHKYDINYELDGLSGFIYINKWGVPKQPREVWRFVSDISKAYHKENPESNMPDVFPHMLRHTFCTNMAHAGMDVKSLQYIMGHSTINMTFSVYAHNNYEDIHEKVRAIMESDSTL